MIAELLSRLQSDEKAVFEAFGVPSRTYELLDLTARPWIVTRNRIMYFSVGTVITEDQIASGSRLYSLERRDQAHRTVDGHSGFLLAEDDGHLVFTVLQDSMQITDPHLVEVAEDNWG